MTEFHDGFSRSGLGAALASLKARRPAGSTGALASAGQLRHSTFAPNPGALEMRLHVPPGLSSGAALVVVLHGCTQTADAFARDSGWIALADRLGFAVLAPEQSPGNNPNRCFNWFQPADMRRGHGEPASIAAMIAEAQKAHGLDAGRTFITGLSAGGAMTAVMLAAYPELFAGGAIVAGAPYGTARGVPQALQTMHGRGLTGSADQLVALLAEAGGSSGKLPPLSIWHGDADHVVNPANAGEIARQWAAGQGLDAEPDLVADEGGYVRSVWRDPSGAVRIELNRVPGLGHGVPLETRGEGAIGKTAPYMLQAGVSSTLEIARFWGLTDGERRSPSVERIGPKAAAPTEAPSAAHTETAFGGLGEQVMSAVSGVPAGVQAVIAGALARSGLLNRPR